MAEFQKMVREFHRLCETQRRLHKNTCDKCPIKIATIGTIFQCYRYVLEKPKEAEDIIMSWAAEHPEPVYPTWYDYLHNIGIFHKKHTAGGDVTELNWGNLMAHIPADIAQKLGVEPKEGT